MFPHDPALLAAARSTPDSVPAVIRTMQTMADLLPEADGLKWFHGLYLQVTEAVQARLTAGGFADPAWLARLDVQFARLYFDALAAWLCVGQAPASWRPLFERRADTAVARIQFAIAGINAHINHDLPIAIAETCRETGAAPQHGSPRYGDYTALNATLESLVATARQTLLVRLLGDPLPPLSNLEDRLAAWSVTAAREAAWTNAELLWAVHDAPPLEARYLSMLDGLTALAGKTLLVPVPLALAGAA